LLSETLLRPHTPGRLIEPVAEPDLAPVAAELAALKACGDRAARALRQADGASPAVVVVDLEAVARAEFGHGLVRPHP
jgi:hypothetical protein